METLTEERPAAPRSAEPRPPRRSMPVALLVAMRPSGVDQEPARLRRPAVLAEAQRGPRRWSDADGHVRRLLRDLERRLPVQRPPRRAARPPPPREAPPADRQRRARRPRRPRRRGRPGGRGLSRSRRSPCPPEVAGLVAALRGDHRRLLGDAQAPGDHRRDDDRLAVHPPGGRRRRRGRGPRLGVPAALHRRCSRSSSASPSAARRRSLRGGRRAVRGGADRHRPGPRALLAAVPRPDGRDGDRVGDHQLRDLRGQQPVHRLARCSRPRPRSSTGSSATCT